MQKEILQKKIEFCHVILLNPQDSLFRGRTSPAVLYKTCSDKQKCLYQFYVFKPICSKVHFYLIGHPKVYIGEECDNLKVSKIFRLIKCKILPPKTLFPVLPSITAGTLIFVYVEPVLI